MASSPTKKRRKQSKAVHTNGLLDYLQSVLPKDKLQELFVDPNLGQFVVKAVLQQLDRTVQQIVVRLRCTGGSFSSVHVWLKDPQQYEHIVTEMDKWGILAEPSNHDGNLQLSTPFFQGLSVALCNLNASPWTAIDTEQQPPNLRDSILVDASVLEQHTQERWDAVLHFLVGSSGHPEPPVAMVNFLLETDLMQPDPDYRGKQEAPLVITESGYDFMLQDVQNQVWHFVARYLYTVERHDTEQGNDRLKHALLFLLSLCCAKVGQPYSTANLSKEYRVFVKVRWYCCLGFSCVSHYCVCAFAK